MSATLQSARLPSMENLKTEPQPTSGNIDYAIGFHRGAIDQTTITTQPPATVMKQVTAILDAMGVEIQVESTFRYRCIRAKKGSSEADESLECESPLQDIQPTLEYTRELKSNVLYGSPPDDSMDEVRFSVELTRLAGLTDTYSLDIRRLKGNLRSYSFIYNTIRERAGLNR